MKYHDPQPNIPQYLHRHAFPKPALWVPHVEGWEPIYLRDFGNACRIYLEDGTGMYMGASSIRVFRQVAAHYGIDRPEMRKHYTAATQRSQCVPLAIQPRNIVFVGFKSRHPEIKNDGAFGYVANTRIQNVEAVYLPEPCLRILLKSGQVMYAPISASNFAYLCQLAGYFQYYLHIHGILHL